MNTEKKVEKSKFAIVNEVAVIFKLGDFGKVESFIRKTAKTLEREVETANRSIKNERHNLKSELSELGEKLEDAQQSVAEAYTNLDPKDLQTNDAQRKYMETYLDAIDGAELAVKDLEDLTKEKKEDSDKVIKNLQDEIAVRTNRISRLLVGAKE